MSWEPLGTFSVLENWTFTNFTKAELIRVTHLSVPIRQDYVKAVIASGFQDDLLVSLFSPQRLTCRQEKEIFSFPNLGSLDKKIVFRRLDKESKIIWKIKIEAKVMLISSTKPQITNAQSLGDITVTNTKRIIVGEKLDGSRRNYLISNLSGQTVFFKYVPLGSDPMVATLILSSTDHDFALANGDKWLDSTLSQNAVIGITANASPTTRLKAVEYNYL